MMGQMAGMMSGMDPIWYLFGTFITVSVILGVYVISRDQFTTMLSPPIPSDEAPTDRDLSDTLPGPQGHSSDLASEKPDQGAPTRESTPEQSSALTVLPDDERRILEPILESPGLTQVELRGRSGFSKAKVSHTVSELEDRGLIYREKQGRTYRVYPGELLKD